MAWTDWESFPAETHTFVRIGHLFMSLAYGGALASLLIIVWRRWQTGARFPSEPGHWLLVFFATGAIVDGVSTFLTPPAHALEYEAWHTHQMMLFLIAATLCFVFARSMHAGFSWASTLLLPGCVLVALAFIHALALGGYSPLWLWYVRQYIQLCTASGLVPVVMLVSIVDWRRCAARDWLHWCGVAVYIAVLAMSAVDRLYWVLRI